MRHILLSSSLLLVASAMTAGVPGTLRPGARRAPTDSRSVSVAHESFKSPAHAAAKALLYGVVLDAQPYVASFTPGYSPAPVSEMTLADATGYSGTEKDGDFYYMDYTANSSGSITAVNWQRIDMDTRTVLATKPQTYALGVCMDMTFDATMATIYGISAVSDVLVKIDPVSGEADAVAATLPFYTLSCDAAGQLYGILLDSQTREGVLYTVNKFTGAAIKVGSTGVKMLTDDAGTAAYFQTATFSRADGRLYWAVVNAEGATGTSALYRVDVATGRASYLAAFPEQETFVALFDLPAAVAGSVPAPATDLSAAAVPEGIKVQFTSPALTSGGGTLGSLTSLQVFRGNSAEAAYSVPSPRPGTAYSWTDTQAQAGFNSYRIVAANADGESLPVYTSAFFGEDYPSPPTALRVAADASGYPVLSWEAPTVGLNGLSLDPSKLTYTVYRDNGAGEETVATGLAATSYTDRTLDLSTQGYPYYYVTATSGAGEGTRSAAAGTYTGPAYKLPFSEPFAGETPSTRPWIMQSLDLGGQWQLGMLSTFPGTGPYIGESMLIFEGFRAVDGAQARISTPLLDFTGVLPELRFHFYYVDLGDDMHFDDHMQIEVSVDGGEFQPVAGADFYQHTANTRWTEVSVPLAAYAGKSRVAIGFHGMSAGGFDLCLDNIRVLDVTAGIDEVAAGADGAVELYDLHGRRVSGTPPAGLYLRRQGSRVDKVMIR